jgi:thioesterase domain-containing protein
VFFVPGGVGGEGEFFVYARLAHRVGPEYPFYGLKARSAEGTDPSADTVEEIAADCVREMLTRQARGPYVIVGECGGGVVAYEVAQQLRREGREVGLLVLMDTLRPDAPAELRALLVPTTTSWGYHREQLRPLTGAERLRYLARVGRRALDTLRASRRRDEAHDVRGTYARARYRYRPQPYPGRLTLLVSEDLAGSSPDLGWKALVRGGIEIHRVRGHHVSYLRGHVEGAARTLRQCLEREAGAARPDGDA